jgi:hypothetical protein
MLSLADLSPYSLSNLLVENNAESEFLGVGEVPRRYKIPSTFPHKIVPAQGIFSHIFMIFI